MLKTLMAKGSLTSVACALSMAAHAVASPPDNINIPAGELIDALKSLASQADIELVYQPEQLRDLKTGGVSGAQSAQEAVSILLQGTALKVYKSAGGAMVIALLAPASGSDSVARGVRTSGRLSAAGAAPAASRIRLAQGGAPVEESSTATARPILEEIVVTSQKREERLLDVPISVSVVSGDDLDRSSAEGISEALSRVPGVAITSAFQGGGPQVAVRGVTAGGPLFNGSSPIAYYLDSVPFGLIKTAIAPDSNAYDLERIEVLRGPQGTLYGASAQNGVVRVLTRDANLNDFEMKTRVSASGTEHGSGNYRGDLAVNAPLVEGKLAVRAVLGYESLSGWIDTPDQARKNDADLRSMRLKIGAQPTDDLSVTMSAWLSRSDYGAPSASDDHRRRSSAEDESISTDYDAFSVRIGYEASRFSLSSMTGYLKYENGSALDLAPLVGVPLPTMFTGLESDVLSQEIVLNSKDGGPWRWSVGAIYRDAEDHLLQLSPLAPVPIDFSDESKSYALYGQVTRLLLDGRLELTGGLRYFEDEVTHIENVPQPPAAPTDPLLPPYTRDFDATSPRVAVAWHPTSDYTVYGSYSEGFRSGFGQNANIIRISPDFPPVEADTLKNYEIGAKGRLLDGRLSFDTALYYIDWEDMQQTLSMEVNGLPTTVVVNGESASGMGFELAAVAEVLTGWNLGINFSWNDLTSDSALTSAGITLFEKGDRLNFSPEYTMGVSSDYVFPLGGGAYVGRLSASANYNSKQTYRNVLGTDRIIDIGEPMLLARASFAVELPERWAAVLFFENLTNESDRGIGLYNIADWPQRVRPRTMGIQLEYKL